MSPEPLANLSDLLFPWDPFPPVPSVPSNGLALLRGMVSALVPGACAPLWEPLCLLKFLC